MKHLVPAHLLCAFILLVTLTSCHMTSSSTSKAAPTLCPELKLENTIPLGVYTSNDSKTTYLCTAPTADFNGHSFGNLSLQVYVLDRQGNSYSEPTLFNLPDGFEYHLGMALSPDGKKMYLSAKNADFFGNDSVNLMVGDVEGTSLTHVTALDTLNTSSDQYVTGVDASQNLLYLAQVGDAYGQVFYCAYQNGTYTPGIIMSEAINQGSGESCGVAVSPDGTHIINTQCVYHDMYYPSLLLSSQKGEKGWESATALDLNINELDHFQFMPTLSGDGKTLYYTDIPMSPDNNQFQIDEAAVYEISLKDAEGSLISNDTQKASHAYDTADFPLKLRDKGDEATKQGVYYELFVRAFADSDGDGIGDFNGITEHLDYLKDLGIDGIWLMPINASPSYHGYDVLDYMKLNPDYGTEEDFKNLLEAAHEKDIKIIMDFVINHTSSDHPWFKSAAFSASSPYRDYYRFVDPSDSKNYVEGAASSWNSQVWHPAGNLDYYGIFSSDMPDLNYNNPKVREEIKTAASHWLNLGVDGFRLDAALHIYGAHEFEQQDSLSSNIQWWNEFALACEAINPDVYLVGEAWSDDDPLADYVQPFDTKFNFTLQSDMTYAVKNGLALTSHGENLASSLETLRDTYDNVDKQYIDGIFASNHDQDRVMSTVGSEEKAKLMAHIYLTLPGNPYIYYGEELGMKGAKPDELIRLDFKWTDQLSKMPNCNWQLNQYDQDFSSENADTPSLEAQEKDPLSMHNLYKTLVTLRKDHEALSSGAYKALDPQNMSVMGYRRYSENENLIILHNLSSKETTVTLDPLKEATLLYSSTTLPNITPDASGTLTLPAYASVVYQK